MNIGALANISQVLAVIIALIVLWIVTSFPIYFVSKLIVYDRSEFGRALLATFLTAAIFVLFFVAFSMLVLFSAPIGFVLILLVLMAVYRIGPGRAFLIALLTFIVFVVLSFPLILIGIVVHLFLF